MDKIIIKFELKQTGEARIEFDGDTSELYAAVMTLIKILYQNILIDLNETEAKLFVEQIAKTLTDPAHPLYEELYRETKNEQG